MQRILIFGTDEAAKNEQAAWLAERYQASLRNPQFFSIHEPERADVIITDQSEIAAFYRDRGVEVRGFRSLKGRLNESDENLAFTGSGQSLPLPLKGRLNESDETQKIETSAQRDVEEEQEAEIAPRRGRRKA